MSLSIDYETFHERVALEHKQKWREEMDHIPWIAFPKGWQIQMLPPFGDAVVRFCVKLPSGKTRSVYLDSRCSLGIWFQGDMDPVSYWEVYPYKGDTARCRRDEVDKLLAYIANEQDGDDDEEEG